MARIFITGSADGLGQLAAQSLIQQGHQVVLHARNESRARSASKNTPGAEAVLIADLASMEETKRLAADANETGRFDAIIHYAGIYQASGREIFAVNVLAPYILTALIEKPKRAIYMSSGMHAHGRLRLDDLQRPDPNISYSDSKLMIVLFTLAVARKWPDVLANAVNPGWVPTKMGGPGAPDSLEKGVDTQVWLAVSNDTNAMVSGCYFHHRRSVNFSPAARDTRDQERFLELCRQHTDIDFPAHGQATA
jgi:NAD(P)-dependent dehydrogenase (short-subunit alcohol dehydrogenase family)